MLPKSFEKSIPFEEWFEINKEELTEEITKNFDLENRVNHCDECDGKGFIECDLGHEHTCEFCNGDTIESDETFIRMEATNQYNTRKIKDRQKALAYQVFLGTLVKT